MITYPSGQDRRFDERPQQQQQQHYRDGKPGNDRGDRKSGRGGGENCDTTARGKSARNQEARKLISLLLLVCSFVLHSKDCAFTSVADFDSTNRNSDPES